MDNNQEEHKKHFVPIILVLLVVSIFFLALLGSRLGKNEETVPTSQESAPASTVPSARASTTIVATPSLQTATVGQRFTITLTLASGENAVNGVQLAMKYDPKLIAVDSILQGTFFSKPLLLKNTNNPTTGEILFALGSTDEKKGTGTIATISARAVGKTTNTQTVLEIEPSSLVSEFNNAQSVLKSTEGAKLVIR